LIMFIIGLIAGIGFGFILGNFFPFN
jgi:hypothetical protein